MDLKEEIGVTVTGRLYYFFFFFLGPHLQHMEIPKLGVESELQVLAYTTVTAMWDLRSICSLYHSSQQYWISNPLYKAWDQTHSLIDTSQIHFCCATRGTLRPLLL